MLHKYASAEWRERYLEPLVQSEISPSFAMTEPAVASSDPTQLKTRAVLDGDEWVINGANGSPLEPTGPRTPP
jgi:alkylation response protein AidB-like acyl-CoA dehydrogenase